MLDCTSADILSYALEDLDIRTRFLCSLVRSLTH